MYMTMRINQDKTTMYCLMVSCYKFIPLIIDREWAEIISKTYRIIEIEDKELIEYLIYLNYPKL